MNPVWIPNTACDANARWVLFLPSLAAAQVPAWVNRVEGVSMSPHHPHAASSTMSGVSSEPIPSSARCGTAPAGLKKNTYLGYTHKTSSCQTPSYRTSRIQHVQSVYKTSIHQTSSYRASRKQNVQNRK